MEAVCTSLGLLSLSFFSPTPSRETVSCLRSVAPPSPSHHVIVGFMPSKPLNYSARLKPDINRLGEAEYALAEAGGVTNELTGVIQ